MKHTYEIPNQYSLSNQYVQYECCEYMDAQILSQGHIHSIKEDGHIKIHNKL